MQRRRTKINDIFNIDLTSPPEAERQQQHSDYENVTVGNGEPISGQSASTDEPIFRRSDSSSLNTSGVSRGNVRRWSQTLSRGDKRNGRKSTRQKTIHFLPSRIKRAFSIDGQLLTNNTIRCNDADIAELTQEIEQHDHLMEDSAYAEQLRIDTLRALPESLTIKRKILARIHRTVSDKSQSKRISRWQKWKYSTQMRLTKWKISLRNTVNNVELWYGSMKVIEGHFGSGVGTYFKFLRWLFALNLLLLLVTIGFIVIPQILYDTFQTKSTDNVDISDSSQTFNFLDLLTGEGYLTTSVLFYGSYENETVTLDKGQYYSIPIAYFLTMICLYIVTFIIVSISMARSYRKSFIETSFVQSVFAHKIFCSWDFGISNKKSAHLKHTSIYNELREFLNELEAPERIESKWFRFWTIASQTTAHLLVFGMLAGLGVAMWTLLQMYVDLPDTILYVSIAVNVTTVILQTVFSWISNMEQYQSTRMALHISLMRNYLLGVVIVGVLLVFWLSKGLTGCWETSIGQEIYRLIIVEFILVGLGGIVYHGIRFLIYKFWLPQIDLPEFDISRGSLGLVFNQTLLWFGLLFSPLLAAMVAIKMILTFYLKKFTLMYFCRPPSKLWRPAQTSTLFLVMTFLSLLGVIVVLGYVMTQIEVSTMCGPFRNDQYMYKFFLERLLELREGNPFFWIVMAITKPAVIGGILILMSVVAYYLRAKSLARIAMVKLLNEMLYLEAKDKEFLLTNITRVTEGKDWLFDDVPVNGRTINQHDKHIDELSATWEFLDSESIGKSNGRPSNGSVSLNGRF